MASAAALHTGMQTGSKSQYVCLHSETLQEDFEKLVSARTSGDKRYPHFKKTDGKYTLRHLYFMYIS